MRRTLPVALILSLLLLSGLLAQEDPVAKATAARDAAQATVDRVKEEMEKAYVHLERDFELVRSERWASVSASLLPPVGAAIAALEGDAAHEPGEELAKAFGKLAVLSESGSRLLALATAEHLVSVVREGGKPEPAAALAAAVPVLFPAETFADCWDEAFQDLPVVVEWRAANETLAKAREALDAAVAAAKVDPSAPEGMVLVGKGRFDFGPWLGWVHDLDKNRRTKESVRSFFIDRTEVTNAEFGAFLAGLDDEAGVVEWLPLGFELKDGKIVVPAGKEQHPVRGLTFLAARAFADAAGKRLPTEEEWERAARGDDGFLYPWGNDFDKDAANWAGRGFGTTVPVGKHSKDSSPAGVFDMAGNVSEMTETLAGPDRKVAKKDLKPADAVITRGGNYTESDPKKISGTYRWTILIDQRKDEVGFRCALSQRDWKR